MSAIYFHCGQGYQRRVSGAERAYLSQLILKLNLAVLSTVDLDDVVNRVCSDDQKAVFKTYPHLKPGFFGVDYNKVRYSNGQTPTVFDLALNTVLGFESPWLTLAARIHGQCEIYGYIERDNFSWFANLIQGALDRNILRKDMGWADVLDLLDEAPPSPVVMSYSVCESFPDGMLKPEIRDSDLPWQGRWDTAVSALRERSSVLELHPENWLSYRFFEGPEYNSFNYIHKGE